MPKTALPGRRGNFVHVPLEELTMIVDRNHPLYSASAEAPLDEAFVENVRQFDVQEPAKVARLRVDGAERLVIVFGRKRYRASLACDKKTLPCIFVKGDVQALFTLMVLENEARQDDTPVEKANKTWRYIQLYLEHNSGAGEAAALTTEAKRQAALVFCVTVKTIEARMKLLTTTETVRDAVNEGKIGFWAATELAGLPDAEQDATLEKLTTEGGERGGKPQVEDAKRAAGKGQSRDRQRIGDARKALLDLAAQYAFDETAADKLLSAAVEYGHAVKKAEKKVAKKARKKAGVAA